MQQALNVLCAHMQLAAGARSKVPVGFSGVDGTTIQTFERLNLRQLLHSTKLSKQSCFLSLQLLPRVVSAV